MDMTYRELESYVDDIAPLPWGMSTFKAAPIMIDVNAHVIKTRRLERDA